jgi:hypothetical protein
MFGMPVRMPASHSGPAFSGSGQGNQSGGTSSATTSSAANSSSNTSASSSGNVSSSGSAASGQNGFSNRPPNRDFNGSSTAIARGEEKMVVTGEKSKETQVTGKTEAAVETDKKFTSSLLETAVSDISSINQQTGSDRTVSSKPKDETVKDKDVPQKKD